MNVERTVFNWLSWLKSPVVRDFYSTVIYTLEGFHELAENIEEGIDWVFEDTIQYSRK